MAGSLWDPGTWPADLGHHGLFIDAGPHLSSYGAAAANFLGVPYYKMSTSSTSYQRSIIVGSANDTNGRLLFPDGDPRFDGMYINGGSATSHGRSLGPDGRDRIREFNEAGGFITGSCAGAFISTSGRDYYLDLVPKKIYLSGYSSTRHDAEFTEEDEIWGSLLAVGLEPDGDGSIRIDAIGHYGGPYFRPLSTDDPRINWHGEIRDSGGRLQGSPYLLEFQDNPWSGMIFVQPSHPEHSTNPKSEKLRLHAAVYAHAMQNSTVAPVVKKLLAHRQYHPPVSYTMIIGDGQYHRYAICVKPGTREFEITLTGLTGNVDLYVQHEHSAHERSYQYISTNPGTSDETVTVQGDPYADYGIWHFSVYGNHGTLNGESYIVTA